MKAEMGRFGSGGFGVSKPPFDYSKLFNRIVMGLIVLVLVVLWIRWSNKQDEIRSQSFDTCYTSYYNYALSTEYISYMQNCMK